MSVKESINAKLAGAFAPTRLRVVDESAQHAGHAGWRESGETHFRIEIVSEAFRGKGRVERHRMINALLAPELAAGVHALTIAARAPEE